MILNFKNFVEQVSSRDQKDIDGTINSIPTSHRNLIKGFNIHFQNHNTLDSDKDHVGIINKCKKSIVIAAPWRYGREFAFLHEIGHLVFDTYVKNTKFEQEWKKILKNTKNCPKQNMEELFCMAYASCYSKHPPTTYSDKKWIDFIQSIKN